MHHERFTRLVERHEPTMSTRAPSGQLRGFEPEWPSHAKLAWACLA
jgi:hypothetical protein